MSIAAGAEVEVGPEVPRGERLYRDEMATGDAIVAGKPRRDHQSRNGYADQGANVGQPASPMEKGEPQRQKHDQQPGSSALVQHQDAEDTAEKSTSSVRWAAAPRDEEQQCEHEPESEPGLSAHLD